METPLAPPPPMPARDRRALMRERYALAILTGFATATRGSVEMDLWSNAKAAVAWADALMDVLGRRYAEDAYTEEIDEPDVTGRSPNTLGIGDGVHAPGSAETPASLRGKR